MWEPTIRQLTQVLVDNAIECATGDGTILVEVTKAGRTASFATRNDWAHDVQTRLGNASASISLYWYARAILEKDHEAAGLQGAILSGTKPQDNVV